MALIVLGFGLRLFLANELPLWNDEAVTANVARSFSDNGIPQLPSGKEYWRGFPYILLVSLSERILGHSDLATRFPSVIMGTATIALTYIAGKNFFDKKTGIVAASIITFLPWQLAWDIQVRMYVMLQLLYLASIIMIYKTANDIEVRKIILTVFLISVSVGVHRTAYILPFVALVYWAIVSLRNRNTKLFGLLLLPIVLGLTYQVIFPGYSELISIINYTPQNFSHYVNWITQNNKLIALLSFLGIFAGARKNIKGMNLLILAVIPGFIVYAFLVDYRNIRYIHFIIPFISLASGAFVIQVTELSSNVLEKISEEYLLIGSVVCLILFNISIGYGFDNSVYRPYFDHKSVYNHISDHDSEEDILITQWTSSATYYYRAPNYSLQGEGYIDIKDKYWYEGRNMYSGAEFIFNASKLEQVISNSSGWLVMRETGYMRKPSSIKYVINGGMREVEGFKHMRVWRWNNTE